MWYFSCGMQRKVLFFSAVIDHHTVGVSSDQSSATQPALGSADETLWCLKLHLAHHVSEIEGWLVSASTPGLDQLVTTFTKS